MARVVLDQTGKVVRRGLLDCGVDALEVVDGDVRRAWTKKLVRARFHREEIDECVDFGKSSVRVPAANLLIVALLNLFLN